MKNIRTILLLFIIASCGKKAEIPDYGVPKDMDVESLSISFESARNGLLYSNLYSEVSYIPLETSDQSIIGEISKLEIANNGDLIIFDMPMQSIVRFDSNGKFICRIGKQGNGHGEYGMPIDMVYDKNTDNVVVLDTSSGKLLWYDLDGTLLSVTVLGYSPSVFAVLDDNHLCLYMNHYDNTALRPIGHNLKIIDKKGNLLSEVMEYDTTMESFHPACENVFFTFGTEICFKQPFSSLVYSIEGAHLSPPTVRPKLYVDFGKSKIPEEWYRGDFMELLNALSETKDITYLMSVYKTKNHILFNVAKNRRVCMYVKDTRDCKLDRYGFNAENDMFGFVSSISLCTLKDNRCYFITDPSEYGFYRQNLSKEGAQFYTVDVNGNSKEYIPSQEEKDFLSSVRDGDNPIIQVCTLKD